MSFAEHYERGATGILLDELNGVDDDDDVRTLALLDALLVALRDNPDFQPTVPGVYRGRAVDQAAAIEIIEGLRARRMTAGQLRKALRAGLAELSKS